MLVSDLYGLIVFHVPDDPPNSVSDADKWSAMKERQDEILYSVKANLARNKDLRRGADLGIPVHILSLLPNDLRQPTGLEVNAVAIPKVYEWVSQQTRAPADLIRPLHAAIQRVSTIKPTRKRTIVKRSDSRGAALKQIEREIANLDKWQKQAAVECPDGPQRIRGLAGSGKTIALALKAAYLHAQNPKWNIGLTFYTRSLYQQFRDLIRRFLLTISTTNPTGIESIFYTLGAVSTNRVSTQRWHNAPAPLYAISITRNESSVEPDLFTGYVKNS